MLCVSFVGVVFCLVWFYKLFPTVGLRRLELFPDAKVKIVCGCVHYMPCIVENVWNISVSCSCSVWHANSGIQQFSHQIWNMFQKMLFACKLSHVSETACILSDIMKYSLPDGGEILLFSRIVWLLHHRHQDAQDHQRPQASPVWLHGSATRGRRRWKMVRSSSTA